MNKIVSIAVGLLLLTACTQEEVFTYGHEKESIQFYVEADKELTQSLNFFTSGKVIDSLYLTVSLIGHSSTEDREFFLAIEPDENSSAAVGLIELKNPYIFEADKRSQKIGIKILKPEEMGSNFSFNLLIDASHDGSDFEQGVIEQQKFILIVQNKLGKPGAWGEYQYAYGSYSDEKYEFMFEVCGNDADFFSWKCWDYWDILVPALDEYNATHDPDKPFSFFY